MKTKMTEVLGIEHPIMLAGMNWLTNPTLVAAVSEAGGLGVLAAAQYNPDGLRAAIREIREKTSKPFGVNLMLGTPGDPRIPIIMEEKVPVLNYALGRPKEIAPVIEGVHGYGGKVIGTTAMLRHAQRSEQLGADCVTVTGYEAAAHSGNVGALVLVPTVAEGVSIPVIGAGGYADGRGLAAALAMGASGVSMGSRLACTQEASVADAVKETWVASSEEDTIIDDRFDGIMCRVLKTDKAEALLKKKSIPLFDAMSAGLQMKKMMGLSWGGMIKEANNIRQRPNFLGSGKWGLGATMRFAIGSSLFVKAIDDPANGILMVGQTVGRIKDIPTVAEVIERTVKEAEDIINALAKSLVG